MAGVTYQVVDGDVEVVRGGNVIWRGDVGGVAYQVIELPGTEDAVVTLNWMHPPEGVEMWHPFKNLVRITPEGRVVWTAPLPGDESSYTGAKWLDGELVGFLWGHTAELDPATGAVKRWWFTK